MLQQTIVRMEYPIVVERKFNKKVIVRGFGRTADEAANKVFASARDYGYWDATKTYPKGQNPSVAETVGEETPERGDGKR